MDCLEVQRLLSDRHSAELVDAVALDGALGHCESCRECATFARSLAILDGIPRPTVPDRVVRATLDAVRAARVADDEATAKEAPTEDEGFEVFRAAERERPLRSWIPRAVAVATIAAVFVGGVGLAVSLMTRDLATDQTAETAPVSSGAPPGEDAAIAREEDLGAESEAGTAGASDGEGERTAPDYVLFSNHVFRVLNETSDVEVEGGSLGSLFTSKDDPISGPSAYVVYEDVDGQIYMAGDEAGVFVRLIAVTRVYEGTTYVLVGPNTLDEYGEWPTLPSHITEPVTEDGAPVFSLHGRDVNGTSIYLRTGYAPSVGIAVPPGTPQRDPAGGNPNWTWWEPLED